MGIFITKFKIVILVQNSAAGFLLSKTLNITNNLRGYKGNRRVEYPEKHKQTNRLNVSLTDLSTEPQVFSHTSHLAATGKFPSNH